MNEDIFRKLFAFLSKEDKKELKTIENALNIYENSIGEGLIEIYNWSEELSRIQKLLDLIKKIS